MSDKHPSKLLQNEKPFSLDLNLQPKHKRYPNRIVTHRTKARDKYLFTDFLIRWDEIPGESLEKEYWISYWNLQEKFPGAALEAYVERFGEENIKIMDRFYRGQKILAS